MFTPSFPSRGRRAVSKQRKGTRMNTKISTPSAVLAAFVAVTLLSPRTAHATDGFPQTIKSYWRINKLPVKGQGCQLCHHDDSGGTVTQPFGLQVRSHGAIKYENSSLQKALDYVYSHHTDSDGDGISDYQEIAVDGTNPNDRKDFKPPPAPPPDGGEGGQPSGTGTGGEGGQPSSVEPPPTYVPPPAEALPPPFEHGCAMTSRPHGSSNLLVMLALAVLGRRSGRRRRSALD
jgi:MYXO-CTERM domain-containing protein